MLSAENLPETFANWGEGGHMESGGSYLMSETIIVLCKYLSPLSKHWTTICDSTFHLVTTGSDFVCMGYTYLVFVFQTGNYCCRTSKKCR